MLIGVAIFLIDECEVEMGIALSLERNWREEAMGVIIQRCLLANGAGKDADLGVQDTV